MRVKYVIYIVLFFFCMSCEKDEENTDNDPLAPIVEPTGPFAYVDTVFDYQYAPGQHASLTKDLSFINGDSCTHMILLGGWGGYVVFGFDHDVINSEGADIIVYSGSSVQPEPGVVYMMDDTNENGLPDDVWYEIKGSEYGKSDCIQDYELTYYRPVNDTSNVTWRDKFNTTGELPNSNSWWWLSEKDSVTYQGTRLPVAYANTAETDGEQFWKVIDDLFSFGYTENGARSTQTVASDFSSEMKGNLFDISDLMNKNGENVSLSKVRFIKVQTGVFQQAGWLGEISTEIYGAGDLSMIQH